MLRSMSDLTHILSQIDAGDPAAAEQLLPPVYDELQKHLRLVGKPGVRSQGSGQGKL